MVDAGHELINTKCAICLSDAHDQEIYPANFKPSDLSPDVFSARRLPDRIHYRMVVCSKCGLMRSNPVLNEESLALLYAQSHFTYAQESAWAAATYFFYFTRYLSDVKQGERILEIGGGNGSFLNILYQNGYAQINGIEPSQEAIQHSGAVSGFMHQGMFARGIFPDAHFDAITSFQVLDHISRPNEFLDACYASLKPGGKIFLIMHDVGSFLARLLGERCPMIDIEHAFLYNKKTLRALLTARGFKVRDVFTVENKYPLKYWAKIMPAPKGIKDKMLTFLQGHPIGQIPCAINAGNMGITAVK